jgi:nucleoid-associated protein YgaU
LYSVAHLDIRVRGSFKPMLTDPDKIYPGEVLRIPIDG